MDTSTTILFILAALGALVFLFMWNNTYLELLQEKYKNTKSKQKISELNITIESLNLANKFLSVGYKIDLLDININDNRIDEKTEKLIKLAANTSNINEANSAALKACQRLASRMK